MNFSRALQKLLFVALFPYLFGCVASVELRNAFPDNNQNHLDTLLSRLPEQSLPDRPLNDSGDPMIVVTLHGDNQGLAAFHAITGTEIWRRELDIDSSPIVGGPVVVVLSGQELVALSVRDGTELWRHESETLDYMGSAIDSGVVVAVFSTAGEAASSFREARVYAFDALSGRQKWTMGPLVKQFGAPAAHAGILMIPWDRLSLSAFDIQTGEEITRLLSSDDMYSFVRMGQEGVFYGSSGIYQLSERSTSGTREGSDTYESLIANAPISEGIYRDGFLAQTKSRSARNKIGFQWRGSPSQDQQVRLVDDTVYFLYFRVVFAFDSVTGQPKWVRSLERDIESAEVVPGGIVVVNGQGEMISIEAEQGAIVARTELSIPVATAFFDLFELPRGDMNDPLMASSVRQQLLDVIFDPDSRLLLIRRFAVSLLANMPDEAVTLDLLDVCRMRELPEAVRQDAGIILRTRRTGTQYLVDALSERHDFLEGTEAPPVGVLASAMVHLDERSTARQLWQHLLDPETPREDLAAIAQALTVFGDASFVPEMRDYVVRYSADSEFHGGESVLLDLVRVIARHGTEEDREAIRELAADPFTLGRFTMELEDALFVPAEEPDEDENADREVVIRASEITEMMEDAQDAMRPCVESASRRIPGLSEIVMNLIIDERGELEELRVEPQDDILTSCLTLSLARTRFPSAEEPRRRARFTIGVEEQ